MAYIETNNMMPGIVGLFQFSPVTAWPLQDLAETLLRMPSSLTQGERELIACYVSHLNKCEFCTKSHSAFAAFYLKNPGLVENVKKDFEAANITDKLKALLRIASKVQVSGKNVQAEDIVRAKVNGASDKEIHDAVLIASAFCMLNRYVDGLGTKLPGDENFYQQNAERVTESGYRP